MAAIYMQDKDYKNARLCLDSMYHDSEKRSKYLEIVKALQP
jgi:hypothetical protein